MSFSTITFDTISVATLPSYISSCSNVDRSSFPGLKTVFGIQHGSLNKVITLRSAESVGELFDGNDIILPKDVTIQNRQRVLVTDLAQFVPLPQDCKIQEFRVYELAPGGGDTFARLMVAAYATRTLYSPNFGVWRSLTGHTDTIFHLWGYRSFDERDEIRERLKCNAQWNGFVEELVPLAEKMESILVSTILS